MSGQKKHPLKAVAGNILTHLRHFTDVIGVRLAGSKEELAAGEYTASVFKSYGASVSVEQFPVWRRAVKAQKLEVKVKGTWKIFACSLLGSAPGTDGKTVEAPLCFFDAHCDYQRKDFSFIRGKAVVHIGSHIDSRPSYRRLMEAKPAFLMFVDVRYPGHVPTSDGLFPSYVADIGAKPTVSIAYFDAWDWMRNGAERARLTVAGGKVKGKSINIVADFSGTDPNAGVIYTGSHIDTQADTVGADDNASGMAFQLELARILAPLRLKRTVRHIAFGTEEQLSVGSAEYVKAHRRNIEKNGIFMFNADSCGSIMGWTVFNYNGPSKIESLLAKHFHKQDIYFKCSHEVIPYTDQFPFAACGVPGLWLHRPNCTAGRFYHHRPENNLAKISPLVLSKTADAAASLITEIAGVEKLPFKRKIPSAQAGQIKACWRDFFGGWQAAKF